MKNYLLITLIVCVNCQNQRFDHENYIKKNPNLHSYELCGVMTDEYKYCNFRDQLYPMDPDLPLFRWVAGHNCYNNTKVRFKNKIQNNWQERLIEYQDGFNYSIPFTYINKKTGEFFYYDYTNETTLKYMKLSLSSEEYYYKWIECAENAEICCENRMTNQNICPDGKLCPTIWDAWDCFSQTEAGTSAHNTCPNHLNPSEAPCKLTNEKICRSDGTWVKKTDYANCQFIDLMRTRHVYHAYILGVSSLFVLPAVIILSIYPSLKVMRVELHRNLLIAILAKNIFMILSKTLVLIAAISDGGLLEYNSGWCRSLAVFEKIAVNSMYACMLVDGFYLHKLLVRVFSTDPNKWVLHGVVAGLSIIPVLIWAIVKAVQNDVYCWIVDDSWRQWLIDGSRYAILGINTILLLDILRVIIWKVRDTVSTSSQHTRFTLRATLVLLPLFGIQFIMMAQRPIDAPCFWDSFFYYISYTIDALQGIIVALLYCYLNKEVQGLLKRSYEQFKFTQERRQTLNMRKNTASTYVDTSVTRKDTGLTNWFRKSSTQPPDVVKSSTPPDNNT